MARKLRLNPLFRTPLTIFPVAREVSYDNTVSGLISTDVKGALDELSGLTGIGGIFYYHTQAIASNTWNVNHGLNRFPNITLRDGSGTMMEGEVSYVDTNNVTIVFKKAGVPFALTGFAYLS
jgi:hypothetical protein